MGSYMTCRNYYNFHPTVYRAAIVLPAHHTNSASSREAAQKRRPETSRSSSYVPCCGPCLIPSSCASWCGFSGVKKVVFRRTQPDPGQRIEPSINQALREKLCEVNLPYCQYVEIKEIFELLDSDGDGLIDTGEFIELMKAHGVKEYADDKEFAGRDRESGGRVTLNEFLDWPSAKEFGTKLSESRKAFDALDISRKGVISVLDFTRLASSMNMNFVSHKDMIDAFREIDRDGDGQISWPQFARIWNEITVSNLGCSGQNKSNTYAYKRADEIDWRPSTPSNPSIGGESEREDRMKK